LDQIGQVDKAKEKKKKRDLDDAVEDDVVVASAARELDEVAAGLGGVLVVHLRTSRKRRGSGARGERGVGGFTRYLDGEGAHGGLEGNLRRAAVGADPHDAGNGEVGRGRRGGEKRGEGAVWERDRKHRGLSTYSPSTFTEE
jgi:hypothetical protein